MISTSVVLLLRHAQPSIPAATGDKNAPQKAPNTLKTPIVVVLDAMEKLVI
jgi:hypothetical protein